MSPRQDQVLDAAIGVLGTEGIRRLTHRAVDATAGMPAGSTSNYFRTREALLTAVVARFATREQAMWELIAATIQPSSWEDLARALAAYAEQATGPARQMTRARYALFLEISLRPELQPELGRTMASMRAWGARWLAELGSADPDRDCRLILNHLDGLMLHKLAFPDDPSDPYPEIARLIRTVTNGS